MTIKKEKIPWRSNICVICKANCMYSLNFHSFRSSKFKELYPVMTRKCNSCGFKTFDNFTDLYNSIAQKMIDNYFAKYFSTKGEQ